MSDILQALQARSELETDIDILRQRYKQRHPGFEALIQSLIDQLDTVVYIDSLNDIWVSCIAADGEATIGFMDVGQWGDCDPYAIRLEVDQQGKVLRVETDGYYPIGLKETTDG